MPGNRTLTIKRTHTKLTDKNPKNPPNPTLTIKRTHTKLTDKSPKNPPNPPFGCPHFDYTNASSEINDLNDLQKTTKCQN